MPKWAKAICGLLLLPACWGTARLLPRIAAAAGDSLDVWVPMASGAGCWIILVLFLPRQAWLYVLGHEMTHVVWSWLFGGKVKRFSINREGGFVVVTRSNFLVALAPYFFPLYAVLVVLLFGVLRLLLPSPAMVPVFHLLLGAAYAFHVTWTWEVLRTEQSDIRGQGILFSVAVIWLGNLWILILGISLLSGNPPISEVIRDLGGQIFREYLGVWSWLDQVLRGRA
jgi:hypothetical protein